MNIVYSIYYISLMIFMLFNILWVYISMLGINIQIPVCFFGYYYTFFMDGVGFLMCYLVTLLTPLCILYAIGKKHTYIVTYCSMLLLTEILLLLVFSAGDLFIFYIFFECVLIPFFIIIGVRGTRSRKINAAYLLLMYTILGSMLLLFALYTIYSACGTFDFLLLRLYFQNNSITPLIWLCFFIGFATKVPMVPFHLWLPEAHVEAPTEGSVILAGAMLKVGVFGIYRVLIQICAVQSMYYTPIVLMLGSVSIIYASLTTLRQLDMKRIIAYSSIAHMNVCIVGLWTFNIIGISGSVLLMYGHGLIASGLFFVIGMLYDRFGTKIIKYYGGFVNTMPILAVCFFFFVLGNISMPGTCNFIGEFFVICGICVEAYYFTVFCVSIGIFMCTVYTLWVYNKSMFGTTLHKSIDLNYREFNIILPLLVEIVFFGIYTIPLTSIYYYDICVTILST